MNRPALDGIQGIPPAVAIEQGNAVRSSRSTVGTVTEVHDHVKVLFARAGVRHCDRCERPVERQSPDSVADTILSELAGQRVLLGFDAPAATAEDWPGLRREPLARTPTRPSFRPRPPTIPSSPGTLLPSSPTSRMRTFRRCC